MSKAGLYNPTIEQGATWERVIYWKDENGALVDLSGYTAAATFRSSIEDATAIIELSTGGSGIVLGGAAGTITLTMTAAQTAALTAPDQGVWQLEMNNGSGVITRLLEGRYIVSREVVR